MPIYYIVYPDFLPRVMTHLNENALYTYDMFDLCVLNSFEIVFYQAIGSRNLLKSITKQREAQQQQLLSLIAEKKVQLER